MFTHSEHVMFDIWYSGVLDDKDIIQQCMEVLQKHNVTIVGEIKHFFHPVGMTCVWLLAESHFSIHTYPEKKYISCDCYICGNPDKSLDIMEDLLLSLQKYKNSAHVNIVHVNKSQIVRGVKNVVLKNSE